MATTQHQRDLTVLGIETSCDETAAALVRREADGKGVILANLVRSQLDLHAAYAVIAENLRAGGAEGVHQFRWYWWLRDHLKALWLKLRGTVPPTPPGDAAGQS